MVGPTNYLQVVNQKAGFTEYLCSGFIITPIEAKISELPLTWVTERAQSKNTIQTYIVTHHSSLMLLHTVIYYADM